MQQHGLYRSLLLAIFCIAHHASLTTSSWTTGFFHYRYSWQNAPVRHVAMLLGTVSLIAESAHQAIRKYELCACLLYMQSFAIVQTSDVKQSTHYSVA